MTSPDATREAAANAIRTFCQSLGAGTVAMTSDGVERIYYAGLSIDALSVAVALALSATTDRDAAIEECAKCVPTTWLDPLLTGPEAVGDLPGRQTEALLRGIQDRIRALKSPEQEGPTK